MAKKPTYEELEQRVKELEKGLDMQARFGDRLQILSLGIEQSSEGIAMSDLDGNLEYLNDAFAQMHGYSAEELMGKNLSTFHALHQMPSVEEANRAVKETGEFKGEIWHTRRDGTVFPTMMHNSIIRDNAGKPIGMMGALRDISDIKKAEEALHESQQQLYQAQKMDALGMLVAGVAHEINNPLSQVMFNMPLLQKLWLDLLPVLKEHSERNPDLKYGGLSYDFLAENLGQLLTDMEMAAKRVATIGSGLKSFARQSSVVDKRPMQINTAVTNAVRLAGTTIKKSGVHLELDLADDLPLMEGNLHCIEQIILNMTINGVEAVDHDLGELKIGTRFQEKDGRIMLLISDNGRGISPSISNKIFDPFVTDKQAEGGTGLGLSVSYSLVKAHDGEITFESRKGEGTTFTLLFPAMVEPKAAKILLVDDDKSLCNVLRKAFVRERPYLVEETANGKEAFIKIATYRPDLLILDIFMPEMDGLEVCRTIKAEPVLADMKVIIITGFPEHPKLKEVAELGFTDVYYKPFDLGDIIKAVDDMLA